MATLVRYAWETNVQLDASARINETIIDIDAWIGPEDQLNNKYLFDGENGARKGESRLAGNVVLLSDSYKCENSDGVDH